MALLKVTALLSSPLVINEDLPHLDGILTWRMARKARTILDSRHGRRHLGIASDQPGALPIPIEQRHVEGFTWPVPLCSNAIIDLAPESVDKLQRRFPTEHAGLLHPSRRIQINTTGGEFKSYFLPMRAVHARAVVWFCVGRGRPQRGLTRDGPREGRAGGASEIRRILRDVSAIGDRTNIGYGRVSEWRVEPTDLDVAWFAEHEGKTVLMRTLPVSMGLPANLLGAKRWFGGIVSPYWARDYYAECVVPC